ncbi:MAG: hypothetical protein ACD_4C00150G0001 [uncultured bacterium (gcode 4)]|uniref:Uncharacterized protein n=1 Tax=uncultured bacterium (gcode 4) TaxID=1234023 RepID=K2F6P9_9BACT|nr:MAG: hypothetical protein ACD_4C00150G0001 [uncultured bacterium (gcode 4)]
MTPWTKILSTLSNALFISKSILVSTSDKYFWSSRAGLSCFSNKSLIFFNTSFISTFLLAGYSWAGRSDEAFNIVFQLLLSNFNNSIQLFNYSTAEQ